MIKKISIIIVTICVIFLSFRLSNAYKDLFNEVEASYKDGSAVNLDEHVDVAAFSSVLVTHGYIQNSSEADFIARTIADSLNKGNKLSSIYDLQKRIWQVPVGMVDSNVCPEMARRVAVSADRLGISSFDSSRVRHVSCDTLGDGMGRITVCVKEEKSPVSGIPVQLTVHYIDTAGQYATRMVGCLVSDNNGYASFLGLDTAASYSVIPVRSGYEYGRSQGTLGGTLGRTKKESHGLGKVLSCFNPQYGDLEFTFEQKEHRVRLFDDAMLPQIREDHTLTLRTPREWKGEFAKSVGLFVLLWLVVWGVIWLRRKSSTVQWPLSVVMALTGISLIGMSSFNDPLMDTMYGVDALCGMLIGGGLVLLMQFIDSKKFYQERYKIPFDIFFSDTKYKGVVYLLLAIGLTALLLTPLAHSVGGMSVNLVIGRLKFQPSEIAKYLIIIFMAVWFDKNIDVIVKYSQEGNASLFWHKCAYLVKILIALLAIMVLYLFLGDMGPGLVIAFTFILMYSIVKSKSDISSDGNGIDWSGLMKSDIVALFAGVVTFFLMLWIGSLVYLKGLFAAVWFVGWIAFWYIRKRQVFETAIMANSIFTVFVFAQIWFKGTGLGDRLAQRSAMCTNTWGNLGLTGGDMAATTNGQVAEGLWGLASGGFWGQGLGKGTPNWIPAFHTDMVLESLGEVMGMFGLLIVVGLLLVLLHWMVATGFKSRNTFTLYLCLGIAIVTAVQFIVIALGSTGIIPLTGVAVPFLSYGSVSMVMNLLAFGVVLSVSLFTPEAEEETPRALAEKRKVETYDGPVMITRFAYFCMSVFLLFVFFHYTVVARNSNMVKPLYVIASRGDAVLQYNPRINALVRQLNAGNIYDRRGRLLATSDKSLITPSDYSDCNIPFEEVEQVKKRHVRRYYPFGERLFFMLGDVNSPLYYNYNEHNPIGYLAESQHLSLLRGYDNVLYEDEQRTKPKRVDLQSSQYCANRFMPAVPYEKNNVVLRDYSALLPLLKAGLGSRRVKRVNEGESHYIKPSDIHLTLDARLQTSLQDRVATWMENTFSQKSRRLKRVSVVVLDAASGDLLASALYPLPNQDTLFKYRDEPYYRDGAFNNARRAHTDRDLGLTFQTAPGSTAKLMSALAGLHKEGLEASEKTFYIYPEEQIEKDIEDTGTVTMHDAIVYSSNCYFVNFVNHYNLYPDLGTVYAATGARLDGEVNGKMRNVVPYYLRYVPMSESMQSHWNAIIKKNQDDAIPFYQRYMEQRTDPQKRRTLNHYTWMWAWGQGTLSASPLNMARVVSTIANGGTMPATRYLLDEAQQPGIPLVSSQAAELLKGYMHHMAIHANKHRSIPPYAINDSDVGGKTGTAERQLNDNKPNDAWFVFYVDNCNVPTGNVTYRHPLAVAVRIERVYHGEGGSARAMQLSKDVVLPALRDLNYR